MEPDYDVVDQVTSLARDANEETLELASIAIQEEQKRRRTLETADEQVAIIANRYQQAMGRSEGDPWVQPTGPLTAYQPGSIVEWDDRLWFSTVAHNVHEPGVSGWRPQALEGEDAPPYVAPSGAHDAYQEGDEVMWEGEVYVAVRDGVVHSPADHPESWRLVEPEVIEPEEPPVEEPEPGVEIPPFIAGEWVEPGDLREYQGVIYQVVQPHQTASHWPPPVVPALWEVYEE